MKLRFTARAKQDLNDIADYICAENPSAALRVRDAILDSLKLLATFPALGRSQNVQGIRKHITRKYRYSVYYRVDRAAGEVAVLTIQHPARAPLY